MMGTSRKTKSGRSGFGILPSVSNEEAQFLDGPSWGTLRIGESVRAALPLRNDGTYPHLDVGSILVATGDVGHIVEIVKVRGALYYTVEFDDLDIVVGARRWELVRLMEQVN